MDQNILDLFFTDSEKLLSPLRVTLFSIGGSPINLFDLIEFSIVFFIAYALGRLGEASIKKIGNKYGNHRAESVSMFGKIIHWSILSLGIILGLSMIGLPITHLAIFVSALSVGIGFGLQTIVNNSIAGLILMSERAVSIGDIIQTPNGRIGQVTMVTIRATKIATPDGLDVIIPNASLIDKAFVNFTINKRGTRKRFAFSVPYGSDLSRIKEIINTAAISVPYCIKPDANHEVEVGITGFGNFGINMELVVWVDPIELMEPYRLESAFLCAINQACVDNNIVIPGPSYTVSVGPAVPPSPSTMVQVGSPANIDPNMDPTKPLSSQTRLAAVAIGEPQNTPTKPKRTKEAEEAIQEAEAEG